MSCLSLQPEEPEVDQTQELESAVARADLFAQLTAQDVREVIESVTREMLGGLEVVTLSE